MVSGDYPREIKWAINQSIRLIVLTTERKNRSTNYDKVVDLLTRDFHPERKKKSVLKCSNQNFFFPNHLFCSLLTLSSSASSPQLLCFSLSLSHFLFPSPLFFTPSLFDLLQLSLVLKSKPPSSIYPLHSACFLRSSTKTITTHSLSLGTALSDTLQVAGHGQWGTFFSCRLMM